PEQRRHPRYGLVLRVDYPDTDEYYSEWTENLSAGGLFVRTDRPFEVGAEVELCLSFPALLDEVRVTGEVAWVRESSAMQSGGIGLQVSSDGSRRRLAELALRANEPGALRRDLPFRVLVVEDNLRVTRSYERVLNRLASAGGGNVEVEFVPNGQVALEVFEKKGADLVITDVYMPVMDGFTFIEQLRKLDKASDTPVIVITGGRAGERERAQQIGVTAFLHKPIQFGRLLETIVALLVPFNGSGTANDES
ncbi:MAG: TIGR02266 family protein, partial [Myxococcota bacterium]